MDEERSGKTFSVQATWKPFSQYPLGESNSWVVSRGKREVQDSGSAESAADCTFKPPLDPQLQLLIERWPTLSKAVQQQFMLLVG